MCGTTAKNAVRDPERKRYGMCDGYGKNRFYGMSYVRLLLLLLLLLPRKDDSLIEVDQKGYYLKRV